ncbi:MAG TPA: HIT domain-containing protein [Roseiflexaceae bacterium]|nr:HIT domain-containing protein [Roseiflexaceae bacterium]
MLRAKSHIAKVLFDIARRPIGGWLAGWVFAYASRILPIRRRYESRLTVAFDHPRPSYPVHILIVPKRAIGGFEDLGKAELPVLADTFAAAQLLVEDMGLAERGYRLIVNGGAYQDVKQLHFHLISE